jgi:hypothetical protein
MKGFIDRTFLPGITFQPFQGKVTPKKILKGKRQGSENLLIFLNDMIPYL